MIVDDQAVAEPNVFSTDCWVFLLLVAHEVGDAVQSMQ